MSETKTYVRFNIAQRIEHIVLIASFLTLCLTGLPQKYVTWPVSEWMIAALGGIEFVRIIHRIAATIFVLETVYHIVILGYKIYVQRLGASMLPGVQDMRDGVQAFLYNLGVVKSRPKFGRYAFDEKMEYWAMIWGMIVMVVTGFMLWNPIATTNFLPGQIIPAAKSAHGAEAVLAFLAIIIWHMYNVHIRTFNKSIWTGKLTEEEMLHEHPLELEAIKAGTSPAPIKNREAVRRLRAYIPIASVVTIALVVGVYYFVSFEKTSIATVPPAESAPVFVLATATPAPTVDPSTQLTWNGAIGPIVQARCGSCHGKAGGLSLKSYAEAMAGNDNGAVIVPGKLDQSALYSVQVSGDHPGLFTTDELALIKQWIEKGAPEN